MDDAPLLSISGLTVGFETARGSFDAIRDVSFGLQAGKILGVVGESGSGKSVTAMAIMGLLPETASIGAGRIQFQGRDLAALPEKAMRAVRGREIAIVFQDPMTSLNPVLTIGRQLQEGLRVQLGLSATAARARAEALLALVQIPSPRQIMRAYPHELSGGMRQRVMIAIALSCEPKLLIADEPTTALDVTTQAQILELLKDIQRQMGMAIMLITHDLGVVAEIADHVQVMYAGRIVERAATGLLFDAPAHPYTEGLLRSMPLLDEEDPEVLPAIPGSAASPFRLPPGCAFHPRCAYVLEACRRVEPALIAGPRGGSAACLRVAGA